MVILVSELDKTPATSAQAAFDLTGLPATAVAHFTRRLAGLPASDERRRTQILRRIEQDLKLVRARARAPRHFDFPELLPVSGAREQIAAAIASHQVVIIAGETGSGKTTQLPKICLELGRGVAGLIGHTQPRRIAARSVAERIAEEMKVSLGSTVGYQVRFGEKISPETCIKLMTDGVMLAEIHNDRLLSRYDTIIIDEAHERSLNIDFLLGYLRQILPKRPDLKVVITSATLETERFSRHFNNAPVLIVEGRTYPVELRYQFDEKAKEQDEVQAICDAVRELTREGPGDILVFLNGEREIRDTLDALEGMKLRDTEVVPLFARLTLAEQQRVFAPHSGRRIVLATNVAETSLTVPGIRFVIDPGTARISRYSVRAKVQRLPIEPVSQASANQRAGRCGRVMDGICVRLYSEADFAARPAYTDPEILRTNLAAVVLQMLSLGLGDIERFPFIQPPDSRQISDAIKLLEEIHAVDLARSGDGRRQLTALGRQLARFPLDPRISRIIVEGAKQGALNETLVIAAALTIQDVRERPLEAQQAADEAHRRFADPRSDFVALLKLWDYLQQQQDAVTRNQFRSLCKREFLAWLRVREWQDLHAQLAAIADELGYKASQQPLDYAGSGYELLHKSVLAGLLGLIGQRQNDGTYLGARGIKFVPFPGGGTRNIKARWVMAAELVETSRLFARTVAEIQPEWVEPLAGDLLKRSYAEPHWEQKRGQVVAVETATLYGLPVVAGRRVSYERIDPIECRRIFIREALIPAQLGFEPGFLRHNRALVHEIEALEERVRRRDLLADEARQFALYDNALPEGLASRVSLQAALKADGGLDQRLRFKRDELLVGDGEVDDAAHPERWQCGQIDISLSYAFNPGSDADGVTAVVPVAVLNQIDPASFEWGIPANRHELVTALIRALPKQLRKHLVPAPDVAAGVLAAINPDKERLIPALTRELKRQRGVQIPEDAWNWAQVPAHLRVRVAVVDSDGKALADGDSVADLQYRLKDAVQASLSQVVPSGLERQGLTEWDFNQLPAEYRRKGQGYEVVAYPALVDRRQHVDILLFDHQIDAELAHKGGVRRLLLLSVPSPVRYLESKLSNQAKLAMYYDPWGKVPELVADIIGCGCESLMARQPLPRNQAEFLKLRDLVRAELNDASLAVAAEVEQLLALVHGIRKRQKGKIQLSEARSHADIQAQLDALVFKGFVAATGAARLGDLNRYLRAIDHRLDKLPVDPNRDRNQQLAIERVQQAFDELRTLASNRRAELHSVDELRWQIEELRVSLFAQPIGAKGQVSEKRLLAAISEVKKRLG